MMERRVHRWHPRPSRHAAGREKHSRPEGSLGSGRLWSGRSVGDPAEVAGFWHGLGERG
jgi:hypothetical protein